MGLLLIAPQGSDILYSDDKLELGRNFMNKLWNSARFILMNTEDISSKMIDYDKLHITDKWILSKLNTSISEIENHYANYKLNEVIKSIYQFVHNYFCDWYIEFVKTRFYGNNSEDKYIAQSVSIHVLKNILRLLHPFTPHITEEIWSFLNVDKDNKSVDKDFLINAHYPVYRDKEVDKNIENDIQLIVNVISAIRNIKASLNISPSKNISIYVRGQHKFTSIIKNNVGLMNGLLKIDELEVGESLKKPSQSATAVVENIEIFIPLKGLIDIEQEIKRLKKQVEDMNGRLNAISKKLDNKNFVNRAPKEIIDHERKKFKDYNQQLEKLEINLQSLNK